MNAKERIAELERQLAELSPNPPVLVTIGGIPQTIVEHNHIGGGSFMGNGYKGRGQKLMDRPVKKLIHAVPLIIVSERGS